VAGNWTPHLLTMVVSAAYLIFQPLIFRLKGIIYLQVEGQSFIRIRPECLDIYVCEFVCNYSLGTGHGFKRWRDKNTPPVDWVQSFYQHNPAYYCTWQWHDSSGCGDESGWIITEYNIGTVPAFLPTVRSITTPVITYS
jgi:hypothetical protein